MNHYRLILAMLLIVVSCEVASAQVGKTGDVNPETGVKFQVVEQMPEFPGGYEALNAFLVQNIKYPKEAQENNIQGRVMVEFVINKDGSIDDVKVVQSVYPALDAEAVRVVSEMPRWKPGKHHGEVVRCKYTVPIMFRLPTEFEDNVNAIKVAAEEGDTEAQFQLGCYYDHGDGVVRNYTEAAKWYRKAAEQGHVGAQFLLGTCYFYGDGVATDHIEAAKWYRKSAEQGHAAAQFLLGQMYEKGLGISKNVSEAKKWYRKSAEQGYVKAQEALESLR